MMSEGHELGRPDPLGELLASSVGPDMGWPLATKAELGAFWLSQQDAKSALLYGIHIIKLWQGIAHILYEVGAAAHIASDHVG